MSMCDLLLLLVSDVIAVGAVSLSVSVKPPPISSLLRVSISSLLGLRHIIYALHRLF